MADLLRAAKLSIDLIHRRDDMRLLLGSKYEAESQAIQQVIKGWNLAPNVSMASAVLAVAKHMDAAGKDPSMLFAAFVDLTEAGGQ